MERPFQVMIALVDFAGLYKRNRGLVCRGADMSADGPPTDSIEGCDAMGGVLQPEELYDELANRIEAEDGPGTKRVFRQLLDSGRPRQEIVSHISRLIEQQSTDKTPANGLEEIRWAKLQSIEPSQIEEHKKPSAWPNTPVSNAADQRLDGSAKRTPLNSEIPGAPADPAQHAGTSYELSPAPQITAVPQRPEKPLFDQKAAGDPENAIRSVEEPRGNPSSGPIMSRQVGASSGYADFSVLERLASKVQFPRELTASEAKQTVRAEPVAVSNRPRAAHHNSRAWPRAPGKILIGTSITVAAAAFFVFWAWYGNELEELSLVNAHRALTWLQGNGGPNVSSTADHEKPTERTGAQQATALRERNITTPVMTAAATQHDFGGRPDTPTVPNTGATSARGTAGVPENTAPRIESAPSQAAERALSPSSTPSRSEQTETDASQYAQTAGPQLPPIDTGTLLTRGDQFLSQSDVASARLLYERAAEAGDGRGALRMGMTFDPVFLARLRLHGVRTDKAQAIAWYRRASALGNADAELLQREFGNLSRGIGSGPGAMASVADQRHRLPRVAARDQGHSSRPRRALAWHAKRG